MEWREQTTQATALLALAGLLDKVERDAHAAFDEAFSPPPPPALRRRLTPEEREARRLLIARMAAAG